MITKYNFDIGPGYNSFVLASDYAALEARLAAIENRVPYICSFCNWTTDSIANGEGHMKVCEKHPMRALEARCRELEKTQVPLKGGIPLTQYVLQTRIAELEAAMREIAKDTTLDPWGLARQALASIKAAYSTQLATAEPNHG